MPKSRGRPSGRGKPKRPQHHVRAVPLPERMMRDAVSIVSEPSVLVVEQWASVWLGQASLGTGPSLCGEIAGLAERRPSPEGLAAVAALRRVASPDEFGLLDQAIEALSADQPAPPWFAEPAIAPVKAWRAVDVWDSERVLFVEYAGATPHTLVAQILLPGGRQIEQLTVLATDAAKTWDAVRDSTDVPMPAVECAVDDVLAELAGAMRDLDSPGPRKENEEFVALRALAWARCRAYLPPARDRPPLDAAERARLLSEFTQGDGELFLDYGEADILGGPLCWSPEEVKVFLTDWLPRRPAAEVSPDILRAWIRFALERRGVDPQWIDPVVRAVDHFSGR